MVRYLRHNLLNNHFLLTNQHCIFWEEERALILSDLHLGKAGHFRKSGIGIPQNIFLEDMQRLLNEVQFFKPEKLIVVGDFFHSTDNKEHQLFEKWRESMHTEIHLIKGNHDILPVKWYEQNGISVQKEMTIGNFSFTHDADCRKDTGYCFTGHVHPGVILYGKGKQSLRFACFYFGKHYAILPAFGKFTGISNVDQKNDADIFIITSDAVLPLAL